MNHQEATTLGLVVSSQKKNPQFRQRGWQVAILQAVYLDGGGTPETNH